MSEHTLSPSPPNRLPPDMADQIKNAEQHRLLVMGRDSYGFGQRLFGPFAKQNPDGSINELDRSYSEDSAIEDLLDNGMIEQVDYSEYVNNVPDEHEFRGNHLRFNAPRTAKEWLERVSNPKYQVSIAASRRMIGSITDRGKMRKAREERLMLPVLNPLGISDYEATELLPNEDNQLTPTREDFRIEIDKLGRDRETAILVQDDMGRAPEDPDYEEKWQRITDITLDDIERYLLDRQRGSQINEAYDKYLRNPNLEVNKESLTITDKAFIGLKLGLARRYGHGYSFELEHMDAVDNADSRKHLQETYNTGPDSDLRSVLKYRPDEYGVLRDNKGAEMPIHLIPIRKALLEDISEVHGLITGLGEYDSGISKGLPDDLFEITQGIFDIGVEALIHRHGSAEALESGSGKDSMSRLVGHIIGYLYIIKAQDPHGKNMAIEHPPIRDKETKRLIWEAKIDAHGHTFFIDEEGNDVYQGDYELIDPNSQDIITNRNFIGDEVVRNSDGSIRAHGNIVYDDDGKAYHKYLSSEHAELKKSERPDYTKLIPLKTRAVQETDSNGKRRPKLLRNPDGTPVLKKVEDVNGRSVYVKNKDRKDITISPDDAITHSNAWTLEGFDSSGNLTTDKNEVVYYKERFTTTVAEKGFVESKTVKRDTTRFTLGDVRLEDVVTDMTQRHPASQGQYVQASVELHMNLLVKAAEEMDTSLWLPGFSEGISNNGFDVEPEVLHKGQKVVTFNGVRKVVENPHPRPKTVHDRSDPVRYRNGIGRRSQTYREFFYALSMYNLMYSDMSKGLPDMSGGGEQAEGSEMFSPEQIAIAQRLTECKEADAFGYSLTPETNKLVERAGKIVKAVAQRHAADKLFPRDSRIPIQNVGSGDYALI